MMSRALRSPVAGDVTVEVVLRGEIDITAVPELSSYLARVLERGPSTLLVDLAGVRFLDCAAARVIVGTGGMLPDGQRPVLRRPRPVVRRLLSVTGLDARCVVEPGLPGG